MKTVDLACSYDGKYLFTAGGEDCTVNMWNVDAEYVVLITVLTCFQNYILCGCQSVCVCLENLFLKISKP